MLAFYSWSTDDGQLVAEKDAPATLLKLASACPAEQRESSSRLVLQALWSTAQLKDGKPKFDRADAIGSLKSLLAQPQMVRDNSDLLGWGADDIVGLLTEPGSRERTDLVAQLDSALDRLAVDATLSTSGRLYALFGKVSLVREPWSVPRELAFGDDVLVPMRARRDARLEARWPGKLSRCPGGSLKKSRQHLERALEICPRETTTLLYLAETYWELKEKRLAIETLERLLALEPLRGNPRQSREGQGGSREAPSPLQEKGR